MANFYRMTAEEILEASKPGYYEKQFKAINDWVNGKDLKKCPTCGCKTLFKKKRK